MKTMTNILNIRNELNKIKPYQTPTKEVPNTYQRRSLNTRSALILHSSYIHQYTMNIGYMYEYTSMSDFDTTSTGV